MTTKHGERLVEKVKGAMEEARSGYDLVGGCRCKECRDKWGEIARAVIRQVLREMLDPDPKWISEAYGYSDFILPKECGGDTREGCIAELKGAWLYILKKFASESNISLTPEENSK